MIELLSMHVVILVVMGIIVHGIECMSVDCTCVFFVVIDAQKTSMFLGRIVFNNM